MGDSDRSFIVAGGSGFIGRAFIEECVNRGYNIIQLVRKRFNGGDDVGICRVYWDPYQGLIERKIKAHALVNLCGANIASKRWNYKRKEILRHSRIIPTRFIRECVQKQNIQINHLFNASAVGYYGDTSGRIADENDTCGTGFLAELAKEWESEAFNIKPYINSITVMRLGIVLGHGGMMRMIRLPFKLGLGAILGDGRQRMSWIHINDVIKGIFYCQEQRIEGAVNFVSPQPVSNEEFSRTVANILKKPLFFRLPKFIIKAMFGEMGEELLLKDVAVVSKKLRESGFSYEFAKLDDALRDIL